MQTTIRVRLSEINISFIEKLQKALSQLADKKDPEVEIVLYDTVYDSAYVEMIKKSAEEMEDSKIHRFTLETLQDFAKS